MDERDTYGKVLGAVVLRLQHGRGLTQRALADRAGLPQATLSRYMHGQTQPDVYALRQLAAALGMAPEQLVAEIETAYRQHERAGGGSR